MNTEKWKDIMGYEGLYMVSNKGRFMSLKCGKTKIIKATLNKKRGYCYIRLNIGKNGRAYIAHRLVAKHFVSGYKDGLDINHKDCNKMNNKASNLEWVTRKENIRHANKNGLMRYLHGEEASKKGRTDKDIRNIFLKRSEGKKIRQIAVEVNMPVSTVTHILLGKLWKYTKIDKSIIEKIRALKNKWSQDFDCCVICGTTDKKHNAKGLCTLCYRQFGLYNST